MNKKTRFIVGLLLLMAPLASQVAQLSHHPKTLLRCEAEITARNRYGPAMEPAAVLKAKMYFSSTTTALALSGSMVLSSGKKKPMC